jgi:ketosteroid isomerase-like protein
MKRPIALMTVSLLLTDLMITGIVLARAETNDEAAIRKLVKQFDAAMNSKSVDSFMMLCVRDPETVYFEDGLPLQIRGYDAFRNYVGSIFGQVSQFHQGTEIERVLVDQNVAVVVSLVRAAWTDSSGHQRETSRFTQVFRRVGNRSLLWHEHVSVPFDETTGKAVLDAK